MRHCWTIRESVREPLLALATMRPILQEERSIFTPRLLSLRQEIRYLLRFPEVNNVSQFRLCLHARARVLRDIEILSLLEIPSRCYRSLSYAILTRVILNRQETLRIVLTIERSGEDEAVISDTLGEVEICRKLEERRINVWHIYLFYPHFADHKEWLVYPPK